jgi:hypothetical protein
MGTLEESEDQPMGSTFAIVTVEANETMSPVHDRQPVILAPRDYQEYLEDTKRPPIHLLRVSAEESISNQSRASKRICSTASDPCADTNGGRICGCSRQFFEKVSYPDTAIPPSMTLADLAMCRYS